MDQKKQRAVQSAFEKGQEAWRQNKSINENPYPMNAEDYHASWNDGWEAEEEIQQK